MTNFYLAFCGTPEYIAPELLLSQGYTKTVDWWTLGVLLYEMLTGLPPFYDENTNEMYRKILQDPVLFPGPEIVDRDARDLLERHLNRDPTKRLGANGAAEIKAHRFFDSIDWKRLMQKKIQPTFKPHVVSFKFSQCLHMEESCLQQLHCRRMLLTQSILTRNSQMRFL